MVLILKNQASITKGIESILPKPTTTSGWNLNNIEKLSHPPFKKLKKARILLRLKENLTLPEDIYLRGYLQEPGSTLMLLDGKTNNAACSPSFNPSFSRNAKAG
jgi:hypothetical protein